MSKHIKADTHGPCARALLLFATTGGRDELAQRFDVLFRAVRWDHMFHGAVQTFAVVSLL